MAPLLLGEAFGWPWLDVVALAAFLLAFGGLTEDHGWRRRIVAGSVGAAVAVAAGTLVGGGWCRPPQVGALRAAVARLIAASSPDRCASAGPGQPMTRAPRAPAV